MTGPRGTTPRATRERGTLGQAFGTIGGDRYSRRVTVTTTAFRIDRERSVIERLFRAGLRWAPRNVAFAVTRTLAAHPRRAPNSPAEAAAALVARRSRAGAGGRLPVLTWGEGPTVVLVHGWGGRATQMAPLALHLAAAGFRAVAFDVTGHGDSLARGTGWAAFVRDIAELAAAAAPLHALVGHSAGGLTMMAARQLRGVRARRYVCINAPHHPYPPLVQIRRRIDPGADVIERYRGFLAGQFLTDWASLEAGCAWEGAGSDLLLCYDRDDRYIDPGDAGRIHARCPGSTLALTRGFGHAGVLAADEVAATAARFLRT